MTNLKETFLLFDTDGDGFIPGRDVPVFIRSFGLNLTDDECEKLLKGKEQALLSFDDIEKLAGSKCSSVKKKDELVKAFKVFDRNGDGTVASGEIKHILLNLGDRLSSEDISELLVRADPQNTGAFKYHEFVDILCEELART